MKKVAVILAQGFEEIEAISVIDVLRRADVSVSIVGLDEAFVSGAHDVVIKTNILFSELNESDFDMIVLPGGLPGATNLADNDRLLEVLAMFDKHEKPIAAICAAPMVLARAGVLKDKFVCYPGFESRVREIGSVSDKNVVKDKNIITAKGPAFAMEFALFLVRELLGDDKFNQVKSDLLL